MDAVIKVNSELQAERRVTPYAAVLVASRSLEETKNSKNASARAFAALHAVNAFISLTRSGRTTTDSLKNTDLLPVAHPLSTRSHSMSDTSIRAAKAQWFAADSRVDNSVRALISSAYSQQPGSLERRHAFARLAALPVGSVPKEIVIEAANELQPIIAVIGLGGNSSAARRARAQIQRRDRKGRFAEMGGGWSFSLKDADGVFSKVSGRVVGSSGDADAIEVEITGNPDLPNGIYTMSSSKGEAVKAILSPEAVKTLPKKEPTASDDVFVDIDEIQATRKDAPSGWSFSGRIKRPTGDTRFYESEDGYEVSVTPNPDGTNTFKLRRREATEGSNFEESYSSWGDVQKAALADQDNYEKELQKSAGQEGEPEAEAPGAPAAPELPSVDERDFAKVDRSVSNLKPGDLIPRYYPSAANELELKKRREDDPSYELEPADEVVSVFKRMNQDPKKTFVRVRDLETNEEREFEVNDSSVIYDTRVYQLPETSAPAEVKATIEEATQGVDEELFDSIFEAPNNSYKLNLFDVYSPQGRTSQDSPDYTDDPFDLSNRFSAESLRDALKDALVPTEDGDPATGVGYLPFDEGDEAVPAEAIYEALGFAGMDAEMLVAGIYDSAMDPDRETTNVDRLSAQRDELDNISGESFDVEDIDTSRDYEIKQAVKRNGELGAPQTAAPAVAQMDEVAREGERNQKIVEIAEDLSAKAEDFESATSYLPEALQKYLPWAFSEDADEQEAFKGLWGVLMSIDGGASDDEESSVTQSIFRSQIFNSLVEYSGSEDQALQLYNQLIGDYGSFPEWVDGKEAIANGETDIFNDPSTAGAFFRLMAITATTKNEERLHRRIDVSREDPALAAYTTPGATFGIDARSFTTNDLAADDIVGKIEYSPKADVTHVVFELLPGDGTTTSIEALSWFEAEAEHIGWGSYEVVNTRRVGQEGEMDLTVVQIRQVPVTDEEGGRMSPDADMFGPSEDVETKKDVSRWKQIGSQLGSNEGGTYEDEAGETYYVKVPKSTAHAENEALASALYRELGVSAVDVQIADANGETRTVSPIVPNTGETLAEKLGDSEFIKKLREDFAIDAWLGNYDVAGLVYDNVIVDNDGNPVRVDPGGALVFRARGLPKGDAFGPKVFETQTLVDPDINPAASRVFGGMSDEEKIESARKLLDITPERIDQIVDSVVTDPVAAENYKDLLKARRADVLNQYGLNAEPSDYDGPRAPSPAASQEEWDQYADALAQHVTNKAVDAAWNCNGGVTAAADNPCNVPSVDEMIKEATVVVPEAPQQREMPSDEEVNNAFDALDDDVEMYVASDWGLTSGERVRYKKARSSVQNIRDRYESGEITREEAAAELAALRDEIAAADGEPIARDGMVESIDAIVKNLDGTIYDPVPAGTDPNAPPEGQGLSKDKVTVIKPGMTVKSKDGVTYVVKRFDPNNWNYVYLTPVDGGKEKIKSTKTLEILGGGDDNGGGGEAPEAPEPGGPELPKAEAPRGAPEVPEEEEQEQLPSEEVAPEVTESPDQPTDDSSFYAARKEIRDLAQQIKEGYKDDSKSSAWAEALNKMIEVSKANNFMDPVEIFDTLVFADRDIRERNFDSSQNADIVKMTQTAQMYFEEGRAAAVSSGDLEKQDSFSRLQDSFDRNVRLWLDQSSYFRNAYYGWTSEENQYSPGVPEVIIDEPLPYAESGIAGTSSMADAFGYVASGEKFASTIGVSVAIDSTDVEDLSIRVQRFKDEEGTPFTRMKFKLTAWAAGRLLDDILKGDAKYKKTEGVEVESISAPDGEVQTVRRDSISFESSAGRTYTVTRENGIKITFIRGNKDRSYELPYRTQVEDYDTINALHNMVTIEVPDGLSFDDVQSALKEAGIIDPRPAVEQDFRGLIENRLISTLGGLTDPSRNINSEVARKAALDRIAAEYDITPNDVSVSVGANGRIELRISKEKAKDLAQKVGITSAIHKISSDPPNVSATTEEFLDQAAKFYTRIIAGPHNALLSTVSRWTDGISASGLSSDPDMASGGADYVFFTPAGPSTSTDLTNGVFSETSVSLVYKAEDVFTRLDFYANYQDEHGGRKPQNDNVSNARAGGYELMLKDRFPIEQVDKIVVHHAIRPYILRELEAAGVTSIGGRPIEDIVTTGGTGIEISEGNNLYTVEPIKKFESFLQTDFEVQDFEKLQNYNDWLKENGQGSNYAPSLVENAKIIIFNKANSEVLVRMPPIGEGVAGTYLLFNASGGIMRPAGYGLDDLRLYMMSSPEKYNYYV